MTTQSNKAINVLYIHGVTQIGGAERELLTWMKALDPNQVHPYVACPSQGPLVTELTDLQIPHIPLSLPSWRKWAHIFRRPFAAIKLSRIIQQWQIDVIHVNDYWWGPIGVMASRLTSCPCVVHVRQEIEPVKVRKYWLKKADMVVPVSQGIGNVLMEAGVSRKNIRVLLSGISQESLDFSTSSGADPILTKIGESRPILGTVANLFPRKGLEFLIQAVGKLKSYYPDIVLVIVGSGDLHYEQHLKQQAKQLNITHNIIFAGFQSNPELFISRFDIFVLPSIQEGFGIVLLEAMSLSKPIVASRIGGIPEIVEHEKTGLLVKPGDAKDLYQALFTLLNDPEKQKRMGNAGKTRLEGHFTLQRMMDGLYGVYRDVLVGNTLNE